MSIRTRILILFGGLIALLSFAQLGLARTLTSDLKSEAGEVAFFVGKSMVNLVLDELPSDGERCTFPGEENADYRIRLPHSTRDDVAKVMAVLTDEAELNEEKRKVIHQRVGALLASTRRLHAHGTRSEDEDEDEDVLRTEAKQQIVFMTTGEPSEHHRLFEREFAFAGEDQEDTALIQIRLEENIELSGNADVPQALSVDFDWRRNDVFVTPTMQVTAEATTEQAPTTPRRTGAARRIPIPQQGFDQASERFLSRLLLGSFAILGLGLVVAGYVAHRVAAPLSGLARAAKDVGDGALGTQVTARGDREVSQTIAAFNLMSTRLSELHAEAQTLREREHLTEIGELARGLAHSLRNPLNILGLAVEELVDVRETGEQRAQLARAARSQIERIDQSLRSFLALSSGHAGNVTAVCVDDLARDVALEVIQDVNQKRRVRVEAPEGPYEVRGVEAELRAVLHTLVINAVEASPAEGVVKVALSRAGDKLRVDVLDAGRGLAQEVRDRIFTPHVTTKETGAGMGLFLAHRIVTNHYGGTLELTDREGGGTRAALVLGPRKQARHG